MSHFLKSFQWVIMPCFLAVFTIMSPLSAHAKTNGLYHEASAASGADFYQYERSYSHNGKLTQWAELKSKLADERSRFAGKCLEYGEFCLPVSWGEHIDKMKTMSLNKKLDYANRLINQYRYATDKRVYGTTDYWATPLELATQKQGDCEDHAIAKFAILIAAGVPEDSLRILILQNTREHFKHAILTVSTGNEVLFLDDQKANVMASTQVPYYQPIYSLNFNGWWLHQQSLAGL